MANDLLDKIQDTEKAISDKEKESIGLEEKHQNQRRNLTSYLHRTNLLLPICKNVNTG